MTAIAKQYPVFSKLEINEMLEKEPKYREMLFSRGYLFTDDSAIDGSQYPFWNNWQEKHFGRYRLFVHPSETSFSYNQNNTVFLLIGHAYNPFRMICDENALLQHFAETYFLDSYSDTISEWTGVFALIAIAENKITVLNDATCLKSCNYCIENGKLYISSHAQLIADLLGFSMTQYAAKIRISKMYNLGMRWLPGFTTPYASIKRVGTNTCLYICDSPQIVRFYPNKPHKEISKQEDYDRNIEEIYQIIRNNLLLCKQKWNHPAISLTGGMDSRTTLACSKGFTNSFEVFSFDSKDQEKVDSSAAEKICEAIDHPHKQYHISNDSQTLRDYSIQRAILLHNTAYVMNPNENEIRKVVELKDMLKCDVEIKSDIAEVGRVFYEQKYAMKMPERLNARHLSILQTRFVFMPILLRKTQKEYRRYLQETQAYQQMYNFEQADIFYWENRVACCSPMTMMTLDPAVRMTFPYNNRKLIEKFLEFPHDLRKADYPQKMIIERKMPEINKSDMQVANLYFGGFRTTAERLFFKAKSLLYIDRD